MNKYIENKEIKALKAFLVLFHQVLSCSDILQKHRGKKSN